MRNVTRIQEPPSFRGKARKWTRELLYEIRTKGKASNYYFNRYNQKSMSTIRRNLEDRLLEMYSKMCCYCEASTQIKQGEIEHLRPKKRFPSKTYDWTNLHWVCSECNGNKLQKYDDVNPILDPSEPEPIDHHIELHIDYDTSWLWLWNINNSLRGDTTIRHPDLNRESLKTARIKTFLRTLQLIKTIRNMTTGTQESMMRKNTLKRLYNGEFGLVTSVREAFAMTQMNYDEI